MEDDRGKIYSRNRSKLLPHNTKLSCCNYSIIDILYQDKDKTRDIQSNIALWLREFLRLFYCVLNPNKFKIA